MKPTVIANANASAGTGGGGPGKMGTNGVTIPINHEYSGGQYHPQSQHHQPQQQQQYADASTGAYGSPRQHPQQHPAHFQQGFGFEPDMDMDMDMDMFPRSRIGRMHHDPFSGFGGSHFGFPQFGSMGRRRPGAGAAAAGADPINDDNDFFTRLPSEFRQYIPETFGHRRSGSGNTMPQQPQQQQGPPQAQYYGTPPSNNGNMGGPQSPSRKLCDAAIQTDEVDGAAPMHGDNLKQHGLRNTVDMGVKSALENEDFGPRSHSAPPPPQQQMPNGKRQTPPPHGGHPQFGTQTSPQANVGGQPSQQQFHKAYYAPQQQTHPQQKQQTPPPAGPQTPGGTYIRTIPIFVEGRSEPVINSHKEIPNQNSAASGPSARAYAPQQQQQQQHRPPPFNTQQPQQQQQGGPPGVPPQTPHTMDSINKIQDIQRDVLDLMSKVEKYTGTRKDKEYAYLDEMLTRNLLKLDTIDTNGKDSIRLARKEAIKCIQASINVLEAKATENAKTAQDGGETAAAPAAPSPTNADSTKEPNAAGDSNAAATATANNSNTSAESNDGKKIQEPIPLPPPDGAAQQTAEQQSAESQKEASPPAAAAAATVNEDASKPSNETAEITANIAESK